MVDQAHVVIKNKSKSSKEIVVKRKYPDGSGNDFKIAKGDKDTVPYFDIVQELIIPAHKVEEGEKVCFKFCTNTDLQVTYSSKEGNWTIKILENDLELDTPTTVNVTVGDDNP